MPTLFRIGACRVHVYANDHGPPHVHVRCPEGEAMFLLGAAVDDVKLAHVHGISPAALRRIASQILDRHDECLKAWRTRHGDRSAGGPSGR